MRTTLFMLYGLCVGIGYAWLIFIAASNEPLSERIAAAFWGVVVILLFTGQGYGVAANSQFSTIQGLAWVAFLPFLLIYSMLAMGLFICVVPYFLVLAVIQERQFRNQLKTRGRFVRLEDLRPKLDAGEGALIQEIGPKGPYRVWWTEDDIFSLGHLPSTDDEFLAIIMGTGRHAFNEECFKTYLDKDTGKARLTSLPGRSPATELARMFPRMRVAMIVAVPDRNQP